MQMVQRIAMICVVGGLLTGLGFFFWWFFDDNTISLGFRIVMAVVVTGLVVLLTVAIWDRYRSLKGEKDEFKEVKY